MDLNQIEISAKGKWASNYINYSTLVIITFYIMGQVVNKRH
jgi:hypothetical protein